MKNVKKLAVAFAALAMLVSFTAMSQSEKQEVIYQNSFDAPPSDDGAGHAMNEDDIVHSRGSVEIYPNPNDGNFTLNLPPQSRREPIIITDIRGKKVYEKLADPMEREMQIDISSLPCGIYVLIKGTATYKFQKTSA